MTESIDFDGYTFSKKYEASQKGQFLREYYLNSETPGNWTRLVDLHVYPTAGERVTPAAFAEELGKTLQKLNPSATFMAYANPSDGAAMLDFVTWTPQLLAAGKLEFNCFKFHVDPHTGNLVSFHYAERVDMDPKQSKEANGAKLRAVRARIVPEVAKTPLYSE